jgi:membrane protease YdiL (CAAX protease family)
MDKPWIQLTVAATGICLAVVDYWILKPAAWTAALTLQNELFPAIVLLICAGLIEELSFRGIMHRGMSRTTVFNPSQTTIFDPPG